MAIKELDCEWSWQKIMYVFGLPLRYILAIGPCKMVSFLSLESGVYIYCVWLFSMLTISQ